MLTAAAVSTALLAASSLASHVPVRGEYADQRLGWCVLPFAALDSVSAHADVWGAEPTRLTEAALAADQASLSPDQLWVNTTMLVPESERRAIEAISADCAFGPVGEMQAMVDEERARLTSTSSSFASLEADVFFNDFRKYPELSAYADSLQQKLAQYTTKFVVSTTIEGRSIYTYKVSTGPAKDGSSKPIIWLQAQQHAREWLASPTLLYFWTELVNGFLAGDKEFVSFVNTFDFYITPMVNIDGYIFTWDSTRLWRKNRRLVSKSTYGVDLNRNWGPASTWGTAGSSKTASSDTYCGTGPFSEPEIQGIRDFFDKNADKLALAIDYHTYGPLLLHPYQYTIKPLPDTRQREQYTSLGKRVQDTINAVNKAKFVSEQGSELYEHSGGLIDYVHDITKGRGLAWTFELRGTNFVVAASEILKSGAEIAAGMRYLVSEVQKLWV